MEERVETTTEKLTTLSLGAAVIGFWFGIGAILSAKMVHSIEELISIKW